MLAVGLLLGLGIAAATAPDMEAIPTKTTVAGSWPTSGPASEDRDGKAATIASNSPVIDAKDPTMLRCVALVDFGCRGDTKSCFEDVVLAIHTIGKHSGSDDLLTNLALFSAIWRSSGITDKQDVANHLIPAIIEAMQYGGSFCDEAALACTIARESGDKMGEVSSRAAVVCARNLHTFFLEPDRYVAGDCDWTGVEPEQLAVILLLAGGPVNRTMDQAHAGADMWNSLKSELHVFNVLMGQARWTDFGDDVEE
ncbi:MAG: hypothetical protein JW809_07370 [Pirellulales bacterium]|nr:hypothetical protein [Pirellulales bacterium]